MTTWGIGQQGFGAYRHQFCSRTLVSQFSWGALVTFASALGDCFWLSCSMDFDAGNEHILVACVEAAPDTYSSASVEGPTDENHPEGHVQRRSRRRKEGCQGVWPPRV